MVCIAPHAACREVAMLANWKSYTVLAITVFIAGCGNPYDRFYSPSPNVATHSAFVGPSSGEPTLLRGTTTEQDGITMLREGFFMVGSSYFHGDQISDELAIIHNSGKKGRR